MLEIVETVLVLFDDAGKFLHRVDHFADKIGKFVYGGAHRRRSTLPGGQRFVAFRQPFRAFINRHAAAS
jgi:hypothetical protein